MEVGQTVTCCSSCYPAFYPQIEMSGVISSDRYCITNQYSKHITNNLQTISFLCCISFFFCSDNLSFGLLAGQNREFEDITLDSTKIAVVISH